jgi:hypothetical protein
MRRLRNTINIAALVLTAVIVLALVGTGTAKAFTVPNRIAYKAALELINQKHFRHFGVHTEVYRADPVYKHGWRRVTQVRSGCEGWGFPYMKARWILTGNSAYTFACGNAAFVVPTPQTGDLRYMFVQIDNNDISYLRGTYRHLRAHDINASCGRWRSNAAWGLKQKYSPRGKRGADRRRAIKRRHKGLQAVRSFPCYSVYHMDLQEGRGVFQVHRCGRHRSRRVRRAVIASNGLIAVDYCGGKRNYRTLVPLKR